MITRETCEFLNESMPAQDEERDRGAVDGKRRRRSTGAGEKDENAEGKRAKKSEQGVARACLPTLPSCTRGAALRTSVRSSYRRARGLPRRGQTQTA
jgi:hypothetical protein